MGGACCSLTFDFVVAIGAAFAEALSAALPLVSCESDLAALSPTTLIK